MKRRILKLLVCLSLFLVVLTLGVVTTYAAPVDQTFTPEYVNGKMWDFDSGAFIDAPMYAATARMKLTKDYSALASDRAFSYIMYWDKALVYIGYRRNTGTYTGSVEYLGFASYSDLLTTMPTAAVYFALVTALWDNDYTPAGMTSTLQTTFADPSYLDYDDSVLSSPLGTTFTTPSYLDYTDSTLGQSLSDAYMSDVGGNLFKNPRFSRGDTATEKAADITEIFGVSTHWNTNPTDTGRLYAEANSGVAVVELSKHATLIAGHQYYFQGDFQSSYDVPYNVVFNIGTYPTDSDYNISASTTALETEYFTFTHSGTSSATYFQLSPVFGIPEDGEYYIIDNLYLYDLTAIFGSGNEPTAADFYTDYIEGAVNADTRVTFGDSYFPLQNLADPTVLAYVDLLALVDDYAVPTYTLTRVLPTNYIGNPYMTSNITGWINSNSTVSWDNATFSSPVCKVVPSIPSTTPEALSYNYVNTTGHKIYARAAVYIATTETITNIGIRVHYSDITQIFGNPSVRNTWQVISGIYTLTSGNIQFGLRLTADSATATMICYWDNVFAYDITALQSSGLFSGMSDSAIKTVLDDYTANGLTASNIGYFFDGPAEWDALTISQKNAILSSYGLAYAGGTVIDTGSAFFTDNFVVLNYGSTFADQMVIEKVSSTYGRQDWYEYDDAAVEGAVEFGDINDTGLPISTAQMLDYSKYTMLWWYDLPVSPVNLRMYYNQLVRDAYHEVERWEWYSWAGVTSANYAYYHQLYLNAVAEVERWEWYSWAGVTSTSYAALRRTYDDAAANHALLTPIDSFADFQATEVVGTYDSVPADPVDVWDSFDTLLTPTFRILIALGIAVVLIFFLAKGGATLPVIVVVVAAELLFGVVVGWLPEWVGLVLAVLAFLFFAFTISSNTSGGGDA